MCLCVCVSFKTMFLDIVVGAKKYQHFIWKKTMSGKIWHLEKFRLFFFNLSWDVILVKEHGCIYGWTNGTKSDNAISIQTMVTRTMAIQKMVGRNMFSRNMVTPNMVGWNLVTPNMVCRDLVTLNMVTPKLLGTRLHRTQPYCGVQHRWNISSYSFGPVEVP